MADTAAHLVDRVLPQVPVRQWVLSLPWAVRFVPAFNAKPRSEVLTVLVGVVLRWQRRRVRELVDGGEAQGGAVTVVQSFGSAHARAAVRLHSRPP